MQSRLVLLMGYICQILRTLDSLSAKFNIHQVFFESSASADRSGAVAGTGIEIGAGTGAIDGDTDGGDEGEGLGANFGENVGLSAILYFTLHRNQNLNQSS